MPQLRFPEFENDGEWNALNGNKIFSQISNKKHNSDLPILAISQEHGAIPRELIDYTVIATTKSVASYKVIEIGDFIISLRSFQGGIEYSKYKGICSPAYIILRNKIDISKDFFRQYFKSRPFIADMNRNLEGLRDGKMVSYKQFSELLLPNPNPREQQKIASCLSSIDELITAESQKLDAYKDHKKGLMQNLFPADGAKVPQFRFPEFEDDGDWVENKLDSACSMQAGVFVKASDINEKKGNSLFPCYGGNGLRGYTSSYTHDGIYSLIGRQGALCGNITLAKSKFHATEHAIVVTPKAQIDTLWFFYMLNRLDLNQYATGQAQPGLSVKNLNALRVVCPQTEAEQQKIANCLSSINELITAQNEKIESLKQHKKGLMQQLFPKA